MIETITRSVMHPKVSVLVGNALILGIPFILVRFLLDSFLPGIFFGITPLILWYGIGIGCAPLTKEISTHVSGILYTLTILICFAAAFVITHHFGLSMKEILIAFSLNIYTWICACYYGGMAFTRQSIHA